MFVLVLIVGFSTSLVSIVTLFILLHTEYWVLLIYRILSLIQISFYLFYDMDALMHLATSMYAVIYLISRVTYN